MKRNQNVSELQSKYLNYQKGSFNTWIELPQGKQNILMIEPNFKFTPLGVLRNLLFRGGVVYISYEFTDSSIESYRINLSGADFGFPANYMPNSFSFSKRDVSRIMLNVKTPNYLAMNFRFQWKELVNNG